MIQIAPRAPSGDLLRREPHISAFRCKPPPYPRAVACLRMRRSLRCAPLHPSSPCLLRHVFRNAHVLAPWCRVAPGGRVHRRLPRLLPASHHRRPAQRPTGAESRPGGPGRQRPAPQLGRRRILPGGPGRAVRGTHPRPRRTGAGRHRLRLGRPRRVRAAGGARCRGRRVRLRHGDSGRRGRDRRAARPAPDVLARAAHRVRHRGRPLPDDSSPGWRPPASVRRDRPGRPARLARDRPARRGDDGRGPPRPSSAGSRTAAPGSSWRAACSSGPWRRTRCGA